MLGSDRRSSSIAETAALWCSGLWVTLLLLTSGFCSARVLHQDANATVPEGGGFLANELPLEIVVTTPSQLADNATESLDVQDQQALTVVYSRSVIALGQDFGSTGLPDDKVPFTLEPPVPGRFRWVTTYIARWDPDGSWPLDSEVKFTFNPNLKTHDGISMSRAGRSVILRTPSLSMSIQSVTSEKATNVTDEGWNAFSGVNSDVLPEVPPDGVVRLRFNTEVSLTALQKNLQVSIDSSNEQAEGLAINVQQCKSDRFVSPVPCFNCVQPREAEMSVEESTCAQLTLDGNLQMGTRYAFVLPEGANYSAADGPLKEEKRDTFGGLRRFVIPFFSLSIGDPTSIATNFLRMWLPHGLQKTNESDIQELKNQFTFTTDNGDEVDFELELEKASVLRMSTSLAPNTNYRVSVNGSNDILDGFGLPLESSANNISTRNIFPEFEVFRPDDSYAIFEASEDWGRKIVAAFKGAPGQRTCPGARPNTVNIYTLLRPEAVTIVSGFLNSNFISQPLRRARIGRPRQLQRTNELDAAELVEIDIRAQLGPTGLVATEFCSVFRTRQSQFVLINESELQAVVVGTENGRTIAWVTSMKTGEPIEGASVTLFIFNNNDPPSSLASSLTDIQGLAFFDGLSGADFARVDYKRKSLFVKTIFSGSDSVTESVASLVLDRALVKPGDTLHIKGYTRGPSQPQNGRIVVSPPFDPENPENAASNVQVDARFGTFELEVPVPQNATNRRYSASFRSEKHFASDGFTVGDPRPPTVGLTVEAPFWSKPDSKVMVNVTAESFIGAAVGDAEITLKWSIPSGESDKEGEVELLTDASGSAFTEIDLGALKKPPQAGERLEIDVSWVGPTRELLEESATVLLRNADVDIDIDRTVRTDFPEQEFGVKVALNNLRGEPLSDRTLVLNFKNISDTVDVDDLPTTSLQPLNGSTLQSCEIQSNSNSYNCRFSIPDLGYFALETCVATGDDSEEQICEVVKLGRTAEAWKENRLLRRHLSLGLVTLTEGPHKVGDELTFGIENPYKNSQALVMWGSRSRVNHMVLFLEASGLYEFTINVGENCDAGCELVVGVMVPRQTEGIAMNPKGVPVAKLFDLAMPHAVKLSYDIKVSKDVPLDVEIAFPKNVEDEAQDFVIAPGETTTIQVNVSDADVNEAEVTVIAADKAVFELVPYALKDLTDELKQRASFGFGMSNSARDLISPRAIQALIEDFMRKKEIDPWFEPTSVLDTFNSPVDQTIESYVNARSSYITESFDDFLPVTFSASAFASASGTVSVRPLSRSRAVSVSTAKDGAPVSTLSKTSAAVVSSESAAASASVTISPPSSSVRVLEDFVSTALFETVIAKDGIATVNFTAPDNVGTFNIRAYVATETKRYGSVESEVIVRRAISLTPSAPRFARVGDEFEAGAVVTVSGANPMQANVSIAIDLMEGASLDIVGDSARVVKVGEDGTEEVRFRFRAKKMGEARFKITANVGPGVDDALIINFPVEGLQEAVTVASSFAIDGNSSSEWQEGLQLPEAVPGSGAVTIQAGVGRLPAVLSMAGQIYESNPEHKCPINVNFALALVTIPFVTETYKVLDLEPAGLDQNSLQVINGIQSNFTAGLESLQEMTRNDIGLDYFLSCKQNRRTFPENPSLFLNARGAFLLNLLENDLNTLQREVIVNGISPLKSLSEEWTDSLEIALLKAATDRRLFNRSISAGSVALARAALGGDWVPPSDTSEQIVEDLSMERLSREFDSMGIESQTLYSVARISMDGGENHPDIQRGVQSWTSNFRVTGRTAYIARFEGGSTPASNVANSLALMVMLKANVDNPLLDKLANYVGSPPVSQYGFRVFSDYDKAVAMITLRDYDVDRGSDQPNLKLQVRSGDFNLLDVDFVGNANPVASSTTPWEELASPPQPLEFRANGTGEVTLAAALTFVPARLLPFPTYRGIFIQRSIYLADSEDSNKLSLKTIPVTSVVEVSIQFTTPDRLGPTTIRALMPAGLEPVDPNIDGSRGFCPVPFASLFGRRVFFFFTCPDQETEPSVVTFRFNSVNSGTQTVSFRAVAATAGTFALPPVRAFVNEQPEVMGLSVAGELEICSGESCVPVEDAPPQTPKNCPKNCNDNGACDLDSGTCLCLDGFIGVDCGELAVA